MMRSIPQRWCCQSFQVNELLTVCRKKGPLACHAERERSIWSHQAGGVAHLGFFAALSMTCPGHFFMACHEKRLGHVMLSAAKHPKPATGEHDLAEHNLSKSQGKTLLLRPPQPA